MLAVYFSQVTFKVESRPWLYANRDEAEDSVDQGRDGSFAIWKEGGGKFGIVVARANQIHQDTISPSDYGH